MTGENLKKIRVLIVEDSEEDAMLQVWQLKKNQFDVEYLIVNNESDFIHSLDHASWDLILSDYNLPQFSGIEALRIYKMKNLDIPFIMVSGAIGEEVAVKAMKEGIHDYVMKNNPERLVPAIERELKESKLRKEKKAAEESVREERLKFERLVNLSPMGLAIIQNDGILKYLNPRAVDFFGYTRSDLNTLATLIEKIFPDQPEYAWARKIWSHPVKDLHHIIEYQFPPVMARDGTSRYIGFRTGRIDEESHFLLMEDISVQRLAMQALEENQKRLWQIIQSVNDIIIEIIKDQNNEYVISSVNDSFIKTTGLLKETILNQSLDKISLYNDKLIGTLKQSINNREAVSFEDTFEINGRTLTWEWGVAPIFSESGKLLRIILSAHDFTERKKSESLLRESETKFRLISSLASDAIWEWQMEKDTIWWNEGVQTLFNYSPNSIEYNYPWLIKKIHPDDRDKFRERIETELNNKSELLTIEHRFECDDHTYKVVNTKINLFYDIHNRPVQALGAMIDLTQRKKMEELRIQSLVEGADNERASIARELHDSLSQNLTLASILLKGITGTRRGDSSVSKIEEAEKIISRVLNDTRDISHNLMPKTLEDFGLKSAIENLAEHLGKGTSFKIYTYFNIEDLRFNKTIEINIFRITQEALNNVIKHAAATQVHISLTKDDHILTLMLEDNGKGFDLNESGDKTGVGLKNIENRAIYLNGKVTIESKKGKGTLIIVDIPV